MKLKWKRVFSLAVAFSMLFSIVGEAAVSEPVGQDAELTMKAGAEPDTEPDALPEVDDGIDAAAEGTIPTAQEAYDAMTALKKDYPEGMTWTNFEPYGSKGNLGSAYTWKGGAIYGAKSAVGCMAFTFILSDEAFGSLPARAIKKGSFTFEDVKVGDILRVNGNSHSVIVLQKSAGGVTVAEANYNKSVHWGRAMSASAVEGADFIVTRYPEGYVPSDSPEDDQIVQSGTAGDVSWSLTGAGTLTVSGNGAIPDYALDSMVPWSTYDYYTVVLEKGVTGIGAYAFYKSKALSVYIPDSVTAVGESAFRESSLVAVTIPGAVKTIGNNAFYKCANLTSASVSEGVEKIGENAFRGCTTLAYIDFPKSITSVGAGAFMSCSEMVSVRFMPGSGSVELGAGLFAQCWKLMSVTLPQMADCISDDMFSSCTLLFELYIPASVKSIGENPFTSCGIKAIYFGGTEAEWNKLMNPYLLASLKSTGTVVTCDAGFKDPFAADPDDPGDFHPDDETKEDPDATTYTVTFDLQGKGMELPEYTGADYKGLTKGSTIKKPADPSAEGYLFKGWYKDAACTVPWDFEKDTVEGNVRLYAGWEKIEPGTATYTVTFNLQGKGTELPEYTGADYKSLTKGSKVKKPADPSAEGYLFKGWYKDAACTIPWDFEKDIVEGDLTLYACWEKITPVTPVYTVTFDLQGHGSSLPEYTGTDYKDLVKGSKVKKPADPGAEGYLFKGWYKDAACTTPWDFEKDAVEVDLTLYAKWLKVEGEVLPGDMPDDGAIKDELWAPPIKSISYTGSAVKPAVRVYKNADRLIEGLDYTVKYKYNTKVCSENAGKNAPTATVTFKGSYRKEPPMLLKFSITEVDLKDVTANDIVVASNKKIQHKVPDVFWNGKKLVNKKDFTISYPTPDSDGKKAYKDAGEYEIKLVAKGSNFTGEKIVKFTIVDPKAAGAPTLMSKVKVEKIKPKQYTGNKIEAAKEELKVTCKVKGKTTPLVEGTDYEVSYENNTNAGTASVILKGKEERGYIGTKRVTFKITAFDLKADEKNEKKGGIRELKGLEDKIEAALKDGAARPRPQLSFKGQKLVEGTDYTISYKNNKTAKPGRKKPTVVIKGKGNFKGTVMKEFTITAE